MGVEARKLKMEETMLQPNKNLKLRLASLSPEAARAGEAAVAKSTGPATTKETMACKINPQKALNHMNHEQYGDAETLTRISQYELAFRMQMAVPDAMDLSDEPAHIHEEYGTEIGKTSFANNCLLARRLSNKVSVSCNSSVGAGIRTVPRKGTISFTNSRTSVARPTLLSPHS